MKRNLQLLVIGTLVLFACGKNEEKLPIAETSASDFVQMEDADLEVDSADSLGFEVQRAVGKSIIGAARSFAEDLLHRAAENVESTVTSQLFNTMQGALDHATIRVAKKGKSFKECVQDKAVLAFVMSNHPNTIHVCPRAAAADPKSLAQVLIHETAHVVGIHDECKATATEVTAMRGSGANLAFKNGYMKRCGIR